MCVCWESLDAAVAGGSGESTSVCRCSSATEKYRSVRRRQASQFVRLTRQ
jgi:hypothetical protein